MFSRMFPRALKVVCRDCYAMLSPIASLNRLQTLKHVLNSYAIRIYHKKDVVL